MATAVKPAIQLSAKETAKLFATHLIMLQLGKACYKRADSALEIIVDIGDRSKPIKLTRRALGRKALAATLREAQKLIISMIVNRKFQVSDKFASRNSIPVGQNARRFEIEEVEA